MGIQYLGACFSPRPMASMGTVSDIGYYSVSNSPFFLSFPVLDISYFILHTSKISCIANGGNGHVLISHSKMPFHSQPTPPS